MNNFDFCTPTRVIFGKGVISELPEALGALGKKVLLTYGGGSIKKTGLYEKIIGLLKDFEVYELSGIEPNPKYSTSVVDGVRICKENKIEVILAVGGGSVLDCSKAIAAGAVYDGETWDLITGKVPTKGALPIVDVLTIAATGSEYDCGAVISRTETNDKTAYIDSYLFPVCSILDPTYTFTVSKKQTAAGVADAMSHVMEQYFGNPSTILNDGMCAAAIKSLMINAPVALKEPDNYDARAQIMFVCTLACNGIFSLGNGLSGWPCHGMEHALSGFYDITHGEGLAILTPRWLKHILCDKTVKRIAQFGTEIMGVKSGLSDYETATQAIQKLYDFFVSIGIPMSLKEVGIDEKRIDEMAHHIAINEGLDDPSLFAPLSEQDIKEILIASL